MKVKKCYLDLRDTISLTNMDEDAQRLTLCIGAALKECGDKRLSDFGTHIVNITATHSDWDELRYRYPLIEQIAALASNLQTTHNQSEAREIFQWIVRTYDRLIHKNVSYYPQMTYQQAVEHCKYWADQIRSDGIDVLTTDYSAAIGVSDQLAYPLDMQVWISAERHPLMYKVCDYAGIVDSDHTNRPAWETLLRLIDQL